MFVTSAIDRTRTSAMPAAATPSTAANKQMKASRRSSSEDVAATCSRPSVGDIEGAINNPDVELRLLGSATRTLTYCLATTRRWQHRMQSRDECWCQHSKLIQVILGQVG